MQKIFRWSALLEYSGTHYSGWQKQAQSSLKTVQGEVESALSQVANEPIEVIVAGRTDAGVHAQHQRIHFDSTCLRTREQWLRGGNRYLPDDIAFTSIDRADPSFHARHCALSRTYQYFLLPQGRKKGLWRDAALYLVETMDQLDLVKMQKAAAFLLGEHDFSAFRSSDCQAKSPRRKMMQAKIQIEGPFLIFTLQANAFLHHMVRNIVGTLLEVGKGVRTLEAFEELLSERKDRKFAGMMLPPQGLYLVDVQYPDRFCLPLHEKSVVMPFFKVSNSESSLG